jgi:flagellar basal body P-ring protein FlgI
MSGQIRNAREQRAVGGGSRGSAEGGGTGTSPSCKHVAAALNALGAKPRDLISIFQALKAAGALRAEVLTR